MNTDVIYLIAGLLLFIMGFGALIIRKDPLHQLLAINVMGVGVFMLFITTGFSKDSVDSVPHALVLTGIVVAVSATAFALALLVRMHTSASQNMDAGS